MFHSHLWFRSHSKSLKIVAMFGCYGLASLAAGGCGAGSEPLGPTGGAGNASGGAVSTGGSSASGGAAVTGGAGNASGGAVSAGGSNASGGADSSDGGASSTGGLPESGGAASDGIGGGGSDVPKSEGCNTQRTSQNGNVSVQSGGAQRNYKLNVPDDYDPSHPYRLILSFHGATGNSGQVAPSYLGLWELAEGSTIFIAPDAVNGIWNASTDVTFVDDILKQVQDDLCIDTSRIALEGFSQGGAMAWTLACARPGIFRAVVVHSGGGLARPSSCEPVAFFSSLGQAESGGAGQTSNSDFFAAQNGCTVASLPQAPRGGHACTNYASCSVDHPTRWCDYDGGHTPSPTDQGQSASWMPREVWDFLSQF